MATGPSPIHALTSDGWRTVVPPASLITLKAPARSGRLRPVGILVEMMQDNIGKRAQLMTRKIGGGTREAA